MLFSEESLIWPCCSLTTCPRVAYKLWLSLMYPRPDSENQRFRKSICPLTPKDQHVICIWICNSERHGFTTHDSGIWFLCFLPCVNQQKCTAPPPVLECSIQRPLLCWSAGFSAPWTGVCRTSRTRRNNNI